MKSSKTPEIAPRPPFFLMAESFCVAFSLYSAIPMPRVRWTEQNMKYAFCFFPLVGAAVGAAMALWWKICSWLHQPVIFAAGAAALPILLTGGIHMDGFCDTMDAMGSHGDAAKRLEIMQDSRAGAFAVMGCVLCLLMTFALWIAFYQTPCEAVFFIFLLSRAFSGFGVMKLRCAKGSGLAASFSGAADRNPVAVIMCVYILLAVGGMALFTLPGALVCELAAVAFFFYYRNRAYRLFGGITGDLAGWFLTLCELIGLMALILIGEGSGCI